MTQPQLSWIFGTLQLNRFYTVEFYHMVRSILSDEGVLVVSVPGSLSYLSEELQNLNLMAQATLGQVFPSSRPVPGETTLWLASPSSELLDAPVETLVDRWTARGLQTRDVDLQKLQEEVYGYF